MEGELAVEQRGGSIDSAVHAVMDSDEALECNFSDGVFENIPDDLPEADTGLTHNSTPALPMHIFGLDDNIEVVDWGADELEIVLEP